MSTEQTNHTGAVGLDIGTSRIVTARHGQQGYRYRSELNAFVSVPFSKLTEIALRKDNVPYAVRGEEILVHGNEAEKFADLLEVNTRRPMHLGILNPAEPDSLPRIRSLLELLLGEGSAGHELYYSTPAPLLGATDGHTYHEESVRRMLMELGFQPKSIHEGLAVVYAEMENSNYSGIGISCGGGLCNVCLAYLAVPVFSFSTAKAGDYIDASAAAASGELATRVRICKESNFHFNGRQQEKVHQALNIYYDETIRNLIGAMKEAFSTTRSLPRFNRPIPMVLSGGTALPRGFAARFEEILRSAEFPVPLSEVRLAADPLNTTAKGALLAALSES